MPFFLHQIKTRGEKGKTFSTLKFYPNCLKIWFDILTPKHLLFLEPMMKKLGKNHKILCTSRNYGQVLDLARIKHVKLLVVGRHGGSARKDKLQASARRIDRLTDIVSKFSPDLAISSGSPEAARVAFGLGIRHVAFSDSPHAEAVMRLTVPFLQKLLIPWVIPKEDFERYGIAKKDIVQYRAIDAASIVAGKQGVKPLKLGNKRKVVVIRLEESAAAYVLGKKSVSDKIIAEFAKEGDNYNVIVLARYKDQANRIRKEFGAKVRVVGRAVDGKLLLSSTNLFVGSGGTMTAEAALMGVPTISYDAVPNHIEKYLIRTGLARRETDPKKIVRLAKTMLERRNYSRDRARKILNSMEDPYTKLLSVIRSL